ncbi:MAG: hypothetical protein MAG471_01296 [Acidimicrobiaceae bacterium]|nr:hypothetical protein [Acidimicrobiaceae bacterium]
MSPAEPKGVRAASVPTRGSIEVGSTAGLSTGNTSSEKTVSRSGNAPEWAST